VQLSSQEIKRLTAEWRSNALGSQGIRIGPQSEKCRLHSNNIGFHELEYDELRTAAVELTKLLLIPGMSTIVDLDHQLLWAWCAELLVGNNGPLSRLDREIYTLAQTTARAALADVNSGTREAFDRARQARDLLNNSAARFLESNHVALSYLCFPLLEAIARRACGDFLDINGVVLQSFPRSSGGSYSVTKRCSNVGDVLRLLRDRVADNTLRTDMNDLLAHVAGIAGSTDGYETVFVWRNSSLHGEATRQTIGGTIYTLSLLIALNDIKSNYIKLRDDAVMRVRREVGMTQATRRPSGSPWNFYPPFYDLSVGR
jgi:hypothetical protein